MTYFWISPINLEKGSQVNPGGWGKIHLEQPVPNLNPTILLREYIFENIRLRFYPEKISRFHCIFLFQTLLDAIQGKTSFNRNMDFIYEVELVKLEAAVFCFDYYFYHLSNQSTVKDFEKSAHHYWTNTQSIIHKELLTESPIKILGKVEIPS